MKESSGIDNKIPNFKNTQSAVLVLAVDSALAMFDEPVKQALYFHLKQKGVDLQNGSTTLESIESAFREIMGAGAEVISLCIRKEIDRFAVMH
jgi:hypothetical protein